MLNITKQECIDYLSSFIETLEDKINQNDPNTPLYEEQIAFFSKALTELKLK